MKDTTLLISRILWFFIHLRTVLSCLIDKIRVKYLFGITSGLAIVFLVQLPSQIFSQTQRNELTEKMYQAIKNNAQNFPQPNALDTIEMGTFDHLTGNFDGLIGRYMEVHDGRKTVRKRVPAVKNSESLGSVLVFRMKHPINRFHVIINNREYRSSSNNTTLSIRIKGSSRINWEIGLIPNRGQPISNYKDALQIIRKKFYAMGVYTLPYLPIGIIYAPPVTGSPQNIISFTQQAKVGTRVELSSKEEFSETRPEMTLINKVYSLLDIGIQKTSNSSDPYTQIANATMKAIRGAFGEEKITNTIGEIKENSLVIESIDEQSVTRSNPIPTLGPVHSDQFVVLKDVRVIWILEDNNFSYSVLDFTETQYLTTAYMRQSNNPDLKNLVALDGFSIRGPNPPRYTIVKDLNGDPIKESISPSLSFERSINKTQIISNHSANTTYSSQIKDYTSGTLAFLGIGFEDKTIKQTFSQGYMTSNSTEISELSKIKIVNGTNELIKLEVYYDNVFGTVAVRLVPKNTVLKGSISNKN
ncbi:hypothetical protein [Flavihumibacter sp.]|uniref:hypothetical protein n=1 Tax=Flavihumibacter sp. TaxID=1913981 RepID=UPI002FC777C2